jgi:transcriptional regulator with XRE-family HTH domain
MKNKPSLEYKLRIGNNIRKWRELKGIKQSQLARQLGITSAALSNIENDKTNLSLHRVEQISNHLQLEVVKLFSNPLDLIPMAK